MTSVPEPKNFEPKEPVKLDPPKDGPISSQELSECNGRHAPILHRRALYAVRCFQCESSDLEDDLYPLNYHNCNHTPPVAFASLAY